MKEDTEKLTWMASAKMKSEYAHVFSVLDLDSEECDAVPGLFKRLSAQLEKYFTESCDVSMKTGNMKDWEVVHSSFEFVEQSDVIDFLAVAKAIVKSSN